MAVRRLPRLRHQMCGPVILSRTPSIRPFSRPLALAGLRKKHTSSTKVPLPTRRGPTRPAQAQTAEFLDPDVVIPRDIGLWREALDRLQRQDPVSLTAEACHRSAIRYCEILNENAGRSGWESALLNDSEVSLYTLYHAALLLVEMRVPSRPPPTNSERPASSSGFTQRPPPPSRQPPPGASILQALSRLGYPPATLTVASLALLPNRPPPPGAAPSPLLVGIRARFDVLVSSLPQSKSLPLPAAVAVRSVGASGSGGGPLARPLTPSETADALTLRALLMLADDLRSSRLRDASAAQSATDTAAAGLPSLAVARAARKWLEAASSAAGEDGANPTEFDFAASNACALALCTSAECSAAAAKLDVDAVRRHLVEIRDLLMPVPFARQGHGSGLGVAAAAVAFARLVFGIHQKQQGRQETDIELARLERSAVTLLHHVATTVADPAACRLLGDLEHAVAKKLSTGVAKTQKTESGDSAGGLLSWWDRRRRQQEVETRLVLASEWFAIAEDMSRLG